MAHEIDLSVQEFSYILCEQSGILPDEAMASTEIQNQLRIFSLAEQLPTSACWDEQVVVAVGNQYRHDQLLAAFVLCQEVQIVRISVVLERCQHLIMSTSITIQQSQV